MYNKETIKLILPDKVIINKNFFNNKKLENEKSKILIQKRIEKILENLNILKKQYNLEKKIEIIYFSEREIKELYSYSTYENTKENIIIIEKNKGQAVKKCPGTKNYLCCNYYTINLYVNCPLKCKYCFLQFYIKNPINTIFINIENIFSQFITKNNIKSIRRIGTGELSDSLVFDPITHFSIDFINFFKNFNQTFFEIKTKTLFTENLYKIKPSKNIVISFSLNSEKINLENEFYTSNVLERIKEAKNLANYGYSIAFHFDPIFFYENYKEDYKKILLFIKDNINPKDIVWISLGTFRYHPSMKEILRQNYKNENITFNESILGYDNKIRYFYQIRREIYSFFFHFFNKNFNVPVYLCMESKRLWQEAFGNLPKNIDNLKNIFNIKK